jgi:neutral amino acid transport system permease protein
MSAIEFYLITLGVLACLNAISALGFNLQFGHAGIVNLAWILLVSAGAYLTAIAAVGPAPHNAFTTYIGGFGWPFPWDVLFGVGATTLFAGLLGVIALRRLRPDYLALALFWRACWSSLATIAGFSMAARA